MGWREFILDFNIPHKGLDGDDIYIQCPFCGADDRKKKMGLNTGSPLYGCWRNDYHRGHNPEVLVAALLHASTDEAAVITRNYFSLNDLAHTLWEKKGKTLKEHAIPSEFHQFSTAHTKLLTNCQKPFLNYITARGLDWGYVCPRYQLRWAMSGEYAQRLIIPMPGIRINTWYAWTGRAISPHNSIRYKTSGDDSASTDHLLFDLKNLDGGDLLVITEGPFDAMKVASCFLPGVSATALFGKNISPTQVSYLQALSEKYKKIILCLDRDAFETTIKKVCSISWYVPNIIAMRPTQKDLGSMSLNQIAQEIRQAEGAVA